MENELVIDNSNFADYFFNVRDNRPQKGQVLAKFTAVAVFGEGREKTDIINLLVQDKATQAAAVMQKIHSARVPDNYRLCAEIAEDLLVGLTVEHVQKKEYEFVLEALYYTQREYVPKGDPHWETIQLLEYDQETGEYRARIEI